MRQRTNMRSLAYVRSRTQPIVGIVAVIALSGCASAAVAHGTPGLVTIQTAVTCPAPPAHAAVTKPPRSFASAPHLTVPKDTGYCAYIDTAAGVISIRLRPEYAPHAVSDFVSLAQHGFYDGLTFYQVCPRPPAQHAPTRLRLRSRVIPPIPVPAALATAWRRIRWSANISSGLSPCMGLTHPGSAVNSSSAKATAAA